ncbi:hypothetical protein Ancab_032185 [Ancistrocladus abbreviatus]
MIEADSEGKYDDLISRGGYQSSRFIAFNQRLPDSKSILRCCSQSYNLKKGHLDPRESPLYRNFCRWIKEGEIRCELISSSSP